QSIQEVHSRKRISAVEVVDLESQRSGSSLIDARSAKELGNARRIQRGKRGAGLIAVACLVGCNISCCVVECPDRFRRYSNRESTTAACRQSRIRKADRR